MLTLILRQSGCRWDNFQVEGPSGLSRGYRLSPKWVKCHCYDSISDTCTFSKQVHGKYLLGPILFSPESSSESSAITFEDSPNVVEPIADTRRFCLLLLPSDWRRDWDWDLTLWDSEIFWLFLELPFKSCHWEWYGKSKTLTSVMYAAMKLILASFALLIGLFPQYLWEIQWISHLSHCRFSGHKGQIVGRIERKKWRTQVHAVCFWGKQPWRLSQVSCMHRCSPLTGKKYDVLLVHICLVSVTCDIMKNIRDGITFARRM